MHKNFVWTDSYHRNSYQGNQIYAKIFAITLSTEQSNSLQKWICAPIWQLWKINLELVVGKRTSHLVLLIFTIAFVHSAANCLAGESRSTMYVYVSSRRFQELTNTWQRKPTAEIRMWAVCSSITMLESKIRNHRTSSIEAVRWPVPLKHWKSSELAWNLSGPTTFLEWTHVPLSNRTQRRNDIALLKHCASISISTKWNLALLKVSHSHSVWNCMHPSIKPRRQAWYQCQTRGMVVDNPMGGEKIDCTRKVHQVLLLLLAMLC